MELEISKRRKIMNVIDWGRGLPSHIAKVIFSKFLVSNLPRCRLVCKTWNDLILDYASSPKFFTNVFFLHAYDILSNCEISGLCNPKMHCIDIDIAKHLDFDLDLDWIKSDNVASLQFDGNWSSVIASNSCNGLLFISKCTLYTQCDGIFNPMTSEFIEVPPPEINSDIYTFGFGFSPRTKQYKLFRIFDPTSIDESDIEESSNIVIKPSTIIDIWTFCRSGTNPNRNQWRHLHCLPPLDIQGCGAYLNGVIYWIGKEKDKENEYVIYALDVETEQIELSVVLEVGPPSTVGDIPEEDILEGDILEGDIPNFNCNIQQFNGSVYATFFVKPTTCEIQVWRMHEKDSWIKEFVINDIPKDWLSPPQYTTRVTLLKCFEDGEILCMVNFDILCLYNPRTRRKKIIPENEDCNSLHIIQLESLNFGSLSNILAGDEEQISEQMLTRSRY